MPRICAEEDFVLKMKNFEAKQIKRSRVKRRNKEACASRTLTFGKAIAERYNIWLDYGNNENKM